MEEQLHEKPITLYQRMKGRGKKKEPTQEKDSSCCLLLKPPDEGDDIFLPFTNGKAQVVLCKVEQ